MAEAPPHNVRAQTLAATMAAAIGPDWRGQLTWAGTGYTGADGRLVPHDPDYWALVFPGMPPPRGSGQCACGQKIQQQHVAYAPRARAFVVVGKDCLRALIKLRRPCMECGRGTARARCSRCEKALKAAGRCRDCPRRQTAAGYCDGCRPSHCGDCPHCPEPVDRPGRETCDACHDRLRDRAAEARRAEEAMKRELRKVVTSAPQAPAPPTPTTTPPTKPKPKPKPKKPEEAFGDRWIRTNEAAPAMEGGRAGVTFHRLKFGQTSRGGDRFLLLAAQKPDLLEIREGVQCIGSFGPWDVVERVKISRERLAAVMDFTACPKVCRRYLAKSP